MSLEKLIARKLSADETQQLIEVLLKETTPMTGLEEVRLFGSAARGEMTEASDIDVVFVFDTQDNAKTGSQCVHRKRKESAKWPTDILCADRKTYEDRSRTGGVFWIAREDGCTIYQREPK